jgi:hypothetical protein
MRPYGVFLSFQAHEFILSRRLKERTQLIRFLQGLADDPEQKGTEFVTDETDRRNEVARIGRFRIVYWSDHAVSEVKVLKIEIARIH